MADFSYLLDEIARRLNRFGDPQLAENARRFAIDRVYFFSNELFFAGEKQDTSLILIPGQASYPLPAGTLEVVFARLNLNGNWIPLERRSFRDILMMDTVTGANPITGPPSYYSIFGPKIRFFTRPDQTYPVELSVESAPLPPREPTDSNFWTNEAFTLIVEATCEDLSRLWLNDEPRANRHGMARERELRQLRGQTHRIYGPVIVEGYL